MGVAVPHLSCRGSAKMCQIILVVLLVAFPRFNETIRNMDKNWISRFANTIDGLGRVRHGNMTILRMMCVCVRARAKNEAARMNMNVSDSLCCGWWWCLPKTVSINDCVMKHGTKDGG